MKSNILLIGFMGVGKGTLARAFVKDSDYFSVDTDDLIESMENRKVKEIFKDNGEAYFRGLEQKTANWLSESVSNTIISTGGGFYKVKNIKNIGKIVYLKSSFEAILEKILSHPNSKKKLKKRPLFKDPDFAKELYNSRVKEYEKIADAVVDVEGKSVKEIVRELKKLK